MERTDLEGVTPFARLVLLTVAEAAREGATPVRSYDVRERCEPHLAALDAFDSGVGRDRVIRALTDLEERGLLRSETVESPVGKGRPAYAPAVDVEALLEALAGDEVLAPAVERVREG